jgi:hypothetical protein
MGLDRESLWNKSKLFMERAIACRNAGEFQEFQLWSAMLLEVLGKSALAHVHPVLVADPQDFESLLAACGASKSPDIRTIQAKTVYSRCRRLVNGFDEVAERFCNMMAIGRNAELHSGAVPFAQVALEAWQSQLWRCVKLLAEAQGESLESMLGSDEAAVANAIIVDASEALGAAVRGRIERARQGFVLGRSLEDRQHIGAAAHVAIQARMFEGCIEWECPACACVGVLSGELVDEELGEPEEAWSDDEPWLRRVKRTYASEHFQCVACRLELAGEEELAVAEVASEFEKEVMEEVSEEEEYGND